MVLAARGRGMTDPTPIDLVRESREEQDHECCPCVERLRAQNKTSSDEWTKRTAKMQSQLHGLQALMQEAVDLNRNATTPNGTVIFGLSQYGNAVLAVALKEADEARAELHTAVQAMHDERRARLAAERHNQHLRRSIAALQSGEGHS